MEVEPFNGSTRCHLGLSHFLAFIRKLSHFPEAQHLLWFLACFGWNTTVFCQSGTLITFEGGSSFTKGRCWCDASEVAYRLPPPNSILSNMCSLFLRALGEGSKKQRLYFRTKWNRRRQTVRKTKRAAMPGPCVLRRSFGSDSRSEKDVYDRKSC